MTPTSRPPSVPFAALSGALLVSLCVLQAGAVAQGSVLEEGPHLFIGKLGDVTAQWIEGGELKTKRFAKGSPVVLPRFKDLLGPSVPIEEHRPPKAVWPMPERLLAISDMEGEYSRLRAFLKNHGVINAAGAWTFGKGHVVCVGDVVDRGTQVTEVLWLLHRLDREARKAGGRLHFIIGNHEVMMMGGDVRYTAPKYAAVAKRIGVTIPGLLGADTEIGRWLRQQNTVERIGDLVFVHAGLSPELVDHRFDFVRVNDAIRAGLGRSVPSLPLGLRALMWSRRGPLWYRGYFPMFALEFGPTPTKAQMTAMMRHLDAAMIIVGHTKVREVGYVDAGRHVLGIDTTWIQDEIVRGVLFEGSKLRVLGLKGEIEGLKLPRTKKAAAPKR